MRSTLALACFTALAACDASPTNNAPPANAAAAEAGSGGSGAGAAPAPAPTGNASLSRDALIGRWGAPTERCGYSTTYGADGTFKDHLFDGTTGGSGQWELQGDEVMLTYSDGRRERERIVDWQGDAYVQEIGNPPVRMCRRRCAPL